MSAADEYLIDQIRSGDTGAWRKLIDRYQGRLVQFAKRRVGDVNTAEDVAQETLVGFVQALPRYDASRSLETFLFAIAHNKLIDYLRRAGRRCEVEVATSESFAQEPADLAASQPSPSGWLLGKEQGQREHRALVHVLRSLVSELQRQGKFLELKVAELIFCAGQRNKEIAAALEIGEKTVAGIKFRLLDRMRERARSVDPHHTLFPGLWT